MNLKQIQKIITVIAFFLTFTVAASAARKGIEGTYVADQTIFERSSNDKNCLSGLVRDPAGKKGWTGRLVWNQTDNGRVKYALKEEDDIWYNPETNEIFFFNDCMNALIWVEDEDEQESSSSVDSSETSRAEELGWTLLKGAIDYGFGLLNRSSGSDYEPQPTQAIVFGGWNGGGRASREEVNITENHYSYEDNSVRNSNNSVEIKKTKIDKSIRNNVVIDRDDRPRPTQPPVPTICPTGDPDDSVNPDNPTGPVFGDDGEVVTNGDRNSDRSDVTQKGLDEKMKSRRNRKSLAGTSSTPRPASLAEQGVAKTPSPAKSMADRRDERRKEIGGQQQALAKADTTAKKPAITPAGNANDAVAAGRGNQPKEEKLLQVKNTKTTPSTEKVRKGESRPVAELPAKREDRVKVEEKVDKDQLNRKAAKNEGGNLRQRKPDASAASNIQKPEEARDKERPPAAKPQKRPPATPRGENGGKDRSKAEQQDEKRPEKKVKKGVNNKKKKEVKKKKKEGKKKEGNKGGNKNKGGKGGKNRKK